MATQQFPHIKRGRMTADECAEIDRLASSGRKLTAGTIARRLNRHPATVRWYMLVNGLIEALPQRRRTIAYRGDLAIHPYTEKHDERLLELRAAGQKFRPIAELISSEFGVPRTPGSVKVRLTILAARPEEMA